MSSLAYTGKPRRLVTKLHRWSGLTLVLFLFITAVTGVFLSFRWEIDALLNPQLFKVAQGDAVLTQTELIERFEATYPDMLVSSLTMPRLAEDSLRVSVKSRMEAHVAHKHVPGMKMNGPFNQAFINPYTGEVLGTRNTSDFVFNRVNFMPFMLRLHYSLFLEKWGVWFMGACAFIWFVTSFLGGLLSWPKVWTSLKSWKPVVSIRAKQGGYKLNYDLHRSASVITFPVLIVVAFTSVYLNLPDVVKPVIEQFSPIGSNMAAPKIGKVDIDEEIITPEEAANKAREILPNGNVYSVSRDFIKGLYSVRIKLPTDVSPNGNNTIFVAMKSGDVVYKRLAAERSGADTFIAWQVPLHAGTAFGLIGQILICISALALAAICVTGFNIWLRKHRSEQQLAQRRKSKSICTEGEIHPSVDATPATAAVSN
ncbi:MAG: hypothetical protein RIR18_535 [Pseudomonadota bacterium]|jgi:uncharacterized iron-regulated membrane protein